MEVLLILVLVLRLLIVAFAGLRAVGIEVEELAYVLLNASFELSVLLLIIVSTLRCVLTIVTCSIAICFVSFAELRAVCAQ